MTFEIGDPPKQRATALMAATALEQALEAAILTRCPDPDADAALFSEENAPLGALHAKIVMARALGLIGPAAAADMGMIRLVRNVFAHSRLIIDFNAPEIVAACDCITLKDRVDPPEGYPDKPAISRYVWACVDFSACLMGYERRKRGKPSAFARLVLDLPQGALKDRDDKVSR